MAVTNSSRGFVEKSCTIFTLKFLSTNSACIFTRKQFFFHYLLHGNKKSLSKLSSCDSKHVPCAVVSYTIYSIKNIYTCKMCHQMDQCLQLQFGRFESVAVKVNAAGNSNVVFGYSVQCLQKCLLISTIGSQSVR